MEPELRPRRYHNLALIGFMGVGKSSVARLIGSQMHMQVVDTDELIEQAAGGMKISEMFARFGEAGFREREREVVRSLRDLRRVVISTGGGLVTNRENMASLKEHSLVVCLWASPEVIWERVRHQSSRPLLQTSDPRERIRELVAQREPFYREADVMVSSERRQLHEVAHNVIHQVRLVCGGVFPSPPPQTSS